MNLVGTGIVFGTLTICTISDMVRRKIHISVLVAFGFLGLIYRLLSNDMSWQMLLGGIGLGLLFVLVSVISREQLGMGDAILLLDCGIFLGFWQLLALIWVASLLAGMTGFVFMFWLKKSKNYRIPFAPYILLGYLVVFAMQQYGGFV